MPYPGRTKFAIIKDLFQRPAGGKVQAVDFVLSRIDVYVGDRSQSVEVEVKYEIPRSAITEAIVNAVAHRDYTSTGSVQIMLSRNRLEVWNPGQLPYHLTIEQLKKAHSSYPANPLLAEPMYLAGYIERMGTGIPDLIKACTNAGLKEPELIQNETFTTLIWRKFEATEQATEQVTQQVKNLVLILENEMTKPNKPTSPKQKYRLTAKGKQLQKQLEQKK